jgi:hypothetical protein
LLRRFAIRAESTEQLLAGWCLLGAAGGWVWWKAVPREARLLAEHRDDFLPTVCGDDA